MSGLLHLDVHKESFEVSRGTCLAASNKTAAPYERITFDCKWLV